MEQKVVKLLQKLLNISDQEQKHSYRGYSMSIQVPTEWNNNKLPKWKKMKVNATIIPLQKYMKQKYRKY